MLDRLELIEKRYNELQNKLIEGIKDVKEMTKIMKEVSDLNDIVETYRLFKHKKAEIESLKKIFLEETDSELIELAEMDLVDLEEKVEKLNEELKILLLPKDPNDEKNVIVEIKGAAGGDEGNIFAGDLFRMYSKYAEQKNWKIEIANASFGTQGGFTSIEFIITGKKVYSFLKYESGVHRVQRVPETESQGRIQTSTATVLVMPEVEEVEVNLNWDDIRVDIYNSSGPGGQSVNTTKSAVRLTHLPTNTVVQCQDGKSQHENKAQAFKILNARVYDKVLQEKDTEEGKLRRSLVKTGDRSEKIRTYNYPQNRVTDHRIGLTIQRLDQIVEGNLDLIIEPLINEMQKQQLIGEK